MNNICTSIHPQQIYILQVYNKYTTNWKLYKIHNNPQQIGQVDFVLKRQVKTEMLSDVSGQ